MRASRLKTLATSSLAYSTEPPFSETLSTIFGRRLHELVLEPRNFWAGHAQEVDWSLPEWRHDGRTKEGREERKEWRESEECRILEEQRAAWLERVEGREILRVSEMEALLAARDSILRHPDAAALLESDEREVSLFWDEHPFGAAKARLDILDRPRRLIVDLKTTGSGVDLRSVQSAIGHWHYDLQAAWYTRAAQAHDIEVSGFAFIFVQNKWPYSVAVYTLTPDYLALGHRKIDALAERWRAEVRDGQPEHAQACNQLLDAPLWAEDAVQELERRCYGEEEE